LTAVPDLIETIGVLESENVISTRVIRKMWGPPIISYWRGWRDAVLALRRYDERGAVAAYTYFEAIATKLEAIEAGKDSYRDRLGALGRRVASAVRRPRRRRWGITVRRRVHGSPFRDHTKRTNLIGRKSLTLSSPIRHRGL